MVVWRCARHTFRVAMLTRYQHLLNSTKQRSTCYQARSSATKEHWEAGKFVCELGGAPAASSVASVSGRRLSFLSRIDLVTLITLSAAQHRHSEVPSGFGGAEKASIGVARPCLLSLGRVCIADQIRARGCETASAVVVERMSETKVWSSGNKVYSWVRDILACVSPRRLPTPAHLHSKAQDRRSWFAVLVIPNEE